MKNKHLTYEQRYGIEVMLKTKINKKEIYKSLGIPSSTLY
ncbi:MAG: IS30 family transposase, partial [Flavobacteriales bacterium]